MLKWRSSRKSEQNEPSDSASKAKSLGRTVLMAFLSAIGLTFVCSGVGFAAFHIISNTFSSLKEERLQELSNATQIIAEIGPMASSIEAIRRGSFAPWKFAEEQGIRIQPSEQIPMWKGILR